MLEPEPNLRILQAEVAALELADGEPRRVTGVLLRDGRDAGGKAVVVTTGTFLNGLAHVGETNIQLAGETGKRLRICWAINYEAWVWTGRG